MTEFVSLNRVRGKKPGANVLATVHAKGDGTQHPALVTHKFGRGRVAAMLLGDVWRWGLKDSSQHEDMDKAPAQKRRVLFYGFHRGRRQSHAARSPERREKPKGADPEADEAFAASRSYWNGVQVARDRAWQEHRERSVASGLPEPMRIPPLWCCL